jgi:hypothetical protein
MLCLYNPALDAYLARFPFLTGWTRKVEVGQLFTLDVFWTMHIESPSGAKFFVLFTDARFTIARSTFLSKHPKWLIIVSENTQITFTPRLVNKIIPFRADYAREFTGHSFRTWMSKRSIKDETYEAHTPERNGLIKRVNKTIVEGARYINYIQLD